VKAAFNNRNAWPWLLAALALFGIAFSIACFAVPFAPSSRAVEDPMLDAIFGGARGLLASALYQRADIFFHEGVPYYKKESFTNDVFRRISGSLNPRAHTHLSGLRVREIMPWLYFTLKADPHNVEAAGVTAFWLTSELDRPDLAEQVLQEAQEYNPRSHVIRQEKGRLYLNTGHIDRAEQEFDTGIRLALSAPQWTNDQFRIEMAEMLMFRGLLRETRGDVDRALADYAETLRLFPGRTNLHARADALSRGAKVEPASEMLKTLRDSRQHVCEREDNGHNHAGAHEARSHAGRGAHTDGGD